MIDASQLDVLSRAISRAGADAVKKVPVVVAKSAVRVRTRMRAEARASASFGSIASTITEDLVISAGGVEAEIGPDKSAGRAASLAGIAYFGTSKPGGATVPDPVLALMEEEPRFVEGLAEVAGFEF
ncbi:hypothetical protein PTW37_06515 [Arthrobacter agilis]|uniref:hypothetical protein n=1 Tax=Arthrobacter agilis TaxID=37921 RepID=UPI0023666123|nr:hypothetical protein [Arthrobacter agilis]WDF34547.1 hypothetical protein PTW37_06515 [Arthrobacter agilis]